MPCPECGFVNDFWGLLDDDGTLLERVDKKGNPYLQVKYYDYDASSLTEMHYLNNQTSLKKFSINFLRSHMRLPELKLNISSASDAMQIGSLLRMPSFVIARKQCVFWKITEKCLARNSR